MKLQIVAGPTASGKTDLAIKLAAASNAVLINADSRQIYKYLSIGTNKGELEQPTSLKLASGTYPVHKFKDTEAIIHLIGFLEPDKDFSVADYQKLVFELISSFEPGQNLVLVGGTGLYIDSVIHPAKYAFAPTLPSEKLKYNNMSVGELQHRIREQSPKLLSILNNSDLNNPRRLANLLVKLQSTQKPTPVKFPQFELEVHTLLPDMDELTKKIDARVEQMFQQGLVEETKKILEMGYNKDAPALTGIGYSQVIEHLDGKTTLAECKQAIMTAHRQYAKKQVTWFKKYLPPSV